MAGSFAHGSTLSLGGQLVGFIKSISLPERTRDELETTDHGSGGDDEFVPGLRRGGSITIEGNLPMGVTGDAGMDAIEANRAANGAAAIEEIVLSFPDNAGATATTFTQDGFVTAVGGNLPFDNIGDFSVTFKVTGAITKAKATAV